METAILIYSTCKYKLLFRITHHVRIVGHRAESPSFRNVRSTYSESSVFSGVSLLDAE
jgi:hypothetical protein